MTASARVALMMSVRDEELFLESHLRFHRQLGTERAYLFLDRCRDRSEELARSFPWVMALRKDRTPDIQYILHYQNACAGEALRLARSEGVDWLLHIDADEFAWGDNGSSDLLEDGSLVLLASRAQPDTEMIVLRTKEVLPIVLPDGAPFWRQVYFQEGRIWERDLLDLATGQVQRLVKWYGHNQGKSMVRVSAAVVPVTSHRWGRANCASPEDAALRTEFLGFHYHYIITGAEHWQRKYRNLSAEPSEWPTGGPVPFPIQSFKEASLRLTPADASEYYRQWLAVSASTAEALRSQGLTVRDTRAYELLEGRSGSERREPSAHRSMPVPNPGGSPDGSEHQIR